MNNKQYSFTLALALSLFIIIIGSTNNKNNSVFEKNIDTLITPANTTNQKDESKIGDIMEPQIGIAVEHRKAVAKILNELLANEWVLYTKTINFHWNVKGIVFHDFHAMFKEQYEQLLELSDEI